MLTVFFCSALRTEMMYFLDQMAIHQCSFCLGTNEFPDQQGNYRRMRHYGEECIVCTSCQGELWNVHEAMDSGVVANFVGTAPGVYAGAKKQRLSEPSVQTSKTRCASSSRRSSSLSGEP